MSNREWIDERHYKIKHVRLNEETNTYEEFYIEYQENETETTVYMTPMFEEMDVKSHNGGISTSTSNFVGGEVGGKPIVWEEEIGGPTVRIKFMEILRDKESVVFKYTTMDDSIIERKYEWPSGKLVK